jgi:general secretion pathway protein G
MKATRKSGFTLVEILIVVIILGILAAIVIPQFTNASQDARKNSLTSQLQTIRSQLELYKLQHKDQLPPSLGTGANDWQEMSQMSDADHNVGMGAGFPFGPYLQQPPANPIISDPAIYSLVGTTVLDHGSGGGANPAGNVGWVINLTTGKVWATSAAQGFIYDEADPSNPNNDL